MNLWLKVGIWDWVDVNGSKEIWSPRFYQLLGYKDQEIEASLENFAALLHPEDAKATFDLVREYFAGRAPFDMEYRLKKKSGDYQWFRGTGEVSRDEQGKPLPMVGSIRDIHQRKQMKDELKSLNERHTLALQASQVGILDWDIPNILKRLIKGAAITDKVYEKMNGKDTCFRGRT